MYLRILNVCLVGAALTACASSPKPEEVAVKGTTDGQTCTREYSIGSSIPKLVCGPTLTEEQRQQNLQDLRNQVRTVPTTTVGGGKGG